MMSLYLLSQLFIFVLEIVFMCCRICLYLLSQFLFTFTKLLYLKYPCYSYHQNDHTKCSIADKTNCIQSSVRDKWKFQEFTLHRRRDKNTAKIARADKNLNLWPVRICVVRKFYKLSALYFCVNINKFDNSPVCFMCIDSKLYSFVIDIFVFSRPVNLTVIGWV